MLMPLLFTAKAAWSQAIARSLPHSAWYHLSAEQLVTSVNGRLPPTAADGWRVYALWALTAAAVAVLAVNRRDV